jgi:light-regulated signal transduction histidine kinase (bacteriophytochrome)
MIAMPPRHLKSDDAMADGQCHSNVIPDAADDSVHGRRRLDATQKALLNILEDATQERLTADQNQRAMINILEDAADEKGRLESTQKAILNILDDAAGETALLADVQRAVINILDDFDFERRKVERANAELRDEVRVRAQVEKSLRRANAATEAANGELEAFSYSVAHDLRAPLRSIDGFSQALIDDCAEHLPAEGIVYLGYVRESAQHMAQLIDGLLSLSRVGRTEMHRSPVDLAAIARTVFARLRRDDPNRAVELAVPAKIPGDADVRLLEVVFENLLGNAWKFTSKRAEAHIEVGQILQNGRQVYFVRDDGAGFDMAYAGKLFAVFQRLHTLREFEGTGIGLANVERIIRRHGGRIWGEGEVGNGATFYFTLEEDV